MELSNCAHFNFTFPLTEWGLELIQKRVLENNTHLGLITANNFITIFYMDNGRTSQNPFQH